MNAKNKILSLLLVLVMLIGVVSTTFVGIFAVEGEGEPEGTGPETTDSAVYAPYYVDDGLVYLWTAEGSAPGATVSSLPNFVDDGETAIDGLVYGLNQHSETNEYDSAFNAEGKTQTNRVVSADGKSVVGDGLYKYDLTKFFPNADKIGDDNRDGDWTYEALITNVKYGNRDFNSDGTYANMKNQFLWVKTTSGLAVGANEGTNFGWINFFGIDTNGQGYTTNLVDNTLDATVGAWMSEEEGIPYTLSVSTDRPNLAAGNPNWSVLYMYRNGDASTVVSGGHNNANLTDFNGPDRAGARSFFFGMGYEEEAYSSIRLYNRKLNDTELAQNHFVDVAYMLDLDMTFYAQADGAQKAEIHALTAGKLASEVDKNELAADIFEIVTADAFEYYPLYVQDDLVYLWTAEGLVPGSTVESLLNKKDDGATAIDTMAAADQFGIVSTSVSEENRVVSADGKSVVGDGLKKYDLTKFFPNAGKVGMDEENRDGDWTYEALITNVAYGSRDYSWMNTNNYLLWAKIAYGFNTTNADGIFNWYNTYTTDQNGSGYTPELEGNATSLAPAFMSFLSETEGNPYTLTIASDRPAFITEGNPNWSAIYLYRSGDVANGAAGYGNYCNNVDTNGDADGYRSFIFGIGYEKEAYSAIRLYSRKLTEAEIAQNHFVDVCYMLGITLEGYADATAETKTALHALTAGKLATEVDKDELTATIQKALLIDGKEASDYITFAGYQAHLKADPAFRVLFDLDQEAIAASDLTVKEIGVLYAKNRGPSQNMGLTEEYEAYEGCEKLVYAVEDDGFAEDFASIISVSEAEGWTADTLDAMHDFYAYVILSDEATGYEFVLYADSLHTSICDVAYAAVEANADYAEYAMIQQIMEICPQGDSSLE